MRSFAVLAVALMTCPFLLADTVYIRDELYVPLRGGQSSEHRILHRGLRSGTPLERLETNDETGYTRVRLKDGMEGWLQTQYIVDEPVAADQLANMKSQVEGIEATHQQTLLRLREATEESDRLKAEAADLSARNEKLKSELQHITGLAADAIAIDQENRRVLDERDSLLAEINALQSRNERRDDDNARQWFLIGAGVVLTSLLLGFLIGRRIYTRRSTGGWA